MTQQIPIDEPPATNKVGWGKRIWNIYTCKGRGFTGWQRIRKTIFRTIAILAVVGLFWSCGCLYKWIKNDSTTSTQHLKIGSTPRTHSSPSVLKPKVSPTATSTPTPTATPAPTASASATSYAERGIPKGESGSNTSPAGIGSIEPTPIPENVESPFPSPAVALEASSPSPTSENTPVAVSTPQHASQEAMHIAQLEAEKARLLKDKADADKRAEDAEDARNLAEEEARVAKQDAATCNNQLAQAKEENEELKIRDLQLRLARLQKR